VELAKRQKKTFDLRVPPTARSETVETRFAPGTVINRALNENAKQTTISNYSDRLFQAQSQTLSVVAIASGLVMKTNRAVQMITPADREVRKAPGIEFKNNSLMLGEGLQGGFFGSHEQRSAIRALCHEATVGSFAERYIQRPSAWNGSSGTTFTTSGANETLPSCSGQAHPRQQICNQIQMITSDASSLSVKYDSTFVSSQCGSLE
jgi:hypothetical protein